MTAVYFALLGFYSRLLSPAIKLITKVFHSIYITIPRFIATAVVTPIYTKILCPAYSLLQVLLRFYYVQIPFSVVNDSIPLFSLLGTFFRAYVNIPIQVASEMQPVLEKLVEFYFYDLPLGVKDSFIPASKIVLGSIFFILFVAPPLVYKNVILPIYRVISFSVLVLELLMP